MVAGCLYPILKSIFKTEGKNLSQWKQWSHSHLHSVKAWPCDLSPYFIVLAKLTTCSRLGTGWGRSLGHRIYGAKCQLSEEQEKLAQGWCSWLPIFFLFPSASTPGKTASSSSCFFLPCLLVWTAAGVTVPHVLCRGWTLEPGLSDAGEFEQAPLSGTLYLHVNLSLSRHCYLNSFKDAISQNFFSCITVTWEHFSSIAQSTSISLANSCRWCFVCKDRSKGF